MAARLVRWALVRDYGFKLPCHSPEFKRLELKGGQGGDHAGLFWQHLRTFDVDEVVGFVVCRNAHAWY